MSKFNLKGFVMICQSTQKDLLEYLGDQIPKIYGEDKCKITKSYIFAKGTLPMCLVSHLDTVHSEKPTDSSIFVSYDKRFIKANEGIGGDDRCGVYLNLFAINNCGKDKPSILFTTDEEIGCIGAGVAAKELVEEAKDIHFLLEIDRRGNKDACFYQTDNPEFEKFILGYGFKKEHGSCSDISTLSPKWGMASVNISSAYYSAHTTSEYVDTVELMEIGDKVVKIVKDSKKTEFFQYKVPKSENTTKTTQENIFEGGAKKVTPYTDDDEIALLYGMYGKDNVGNPFWYQ